VTSYRLLTLSLNLFIYDINLFNQYDKYVWVKRASAYKEIERSSQVAAS